MSQFYSSFVNVIDTLSDIAWSPVTLIFFMGTGLFLTIYLKFIQVRYFKESIKVLTTKPFDEDKTTDQISGFRALATVLSGTIGTGNIAGVATAIAIGGPGAIFWMWVTAFLGMAIKFSSCTLAHKYRIIEKSGDILGGPMVTIQNALKQNIWTKILGVMFASFIMIASLTTGNMVQANSIVDGLGYIFPDLNGYRIYIGIFLAFTIGTVILGGVKRISYIAGIVIPFIAIAYVLCALFILGLNYKAVPHSFYLIITDAFSVNATFGASLWVIIRSGISRGIFSSESGLGSSPIVIATLKTDKSINAGFLDMIGPLFDTLLICTMTALVIISTGHYGNNIPDNLIGTPLSQHAFATGLSGAFGKQGEILGGTIVGIGLFLFAYTTTITWCYYGDRGSYFLFGPKAVTPFRIIFLICFVIGSIIPLKLVWEMADIANMGIALPNLISILILSKTLKKMVYNKKEVN
tara:strand:+ start:214 stop:1608 length:1395 start_codon:yes stop_codon:yes gene_type:complete